MEDDDDRQLLTRIAAGDIAAFTALDGRFRATLLAYAHVFTRDRGTAEEIVQDTLVAIWRGAGRYEGRSTVRAWILAIARRRAADRCRTSVPRAIDDADLTDIVDHAPGPEDLALQTVAVDDLAAAIDCLNQLHREPLLLFFAHGLSYQEVADVLQIPLGTVKSRIRNARLLLRAALSPESDKP